MIIHNALLLSLLAGSATAGSNGAEPLGFLALDSSARATALGGAYTALAQDSHALHYNPGGLGFIERHEASFTHNEHFEGAHQEHAALALRQGMGIALNYLGVGDVPRTTINQPDGTLGRFGGGSLAIAAGYGRKLGDLGLGAGLKHLREKIDERIGESVAFDLGALWRSPVEGLSLGAALQHMGPDIKYVGRSESLPLTFRAAGAYSATLAKGLDSTLALDLAKERSEDLAVHLGAEALLAKAFALRLGFSSRNSADVGLSGGIGWSQPDFAIDYSLVPFGELGLTHRASLTVRWGSAIDQR